MVTTSPHGFELAESRSLALAQAAGGFQARAVGWLVARLRRNGFSGLTAAQLAFLGALDCGDNHASALARSLGVSRQAIHKQVKELTALGWLETAADPRLGNQKTIRFTVEGERMMSAARAAFAELDARLEAALGTGALDAATAALAFDGFGD